MSMKANACPRCLTILVPGGIHTCTPTPLVRGLEERIAKLEAFYLARVGEPPLSEVDAELRNCKIATRLLASCLTGIGDQEREALAAAKPYLLE